MGRSIPFDKRVESYVERIPFSGCWIWTGAIFPMTGYGEMRVNGKNQGAHRAVYEHFVGKVPQGMWLDHLCRVRCCVNPKHLEPVTPRENTMRGDTPARKNFEKIHCKNGHLFSNENVYVRPSGHRTCRICRTESKRKARTLKKEKAKS
jgi:hypothetical protein